MAQQDVTLVSATASLGDTNWASVTGFAAGRWRKLTIVNRNTTQLLSWRIAATGAAIDIPANSTGTAYWEEDFGEAGLELDATNLLQVASGTGSSHEYIVLGQKYA